VLEKTFRGDSTAKSGDQLLVCVQGEFEFGEDPPGKRVFDSQI
jgi:hypothetical protein